MTTFSHDQIVGGHFLGTEGWSQCSGMLVFTGIDLCRAQVLAPCVGKHVGSSSGHADYMIFLSLFGYVRRCSNLPTKELRCNLPISVWHPFYTIKTLDAIVQALRADPTAIGVLVFTGNDLCRAQILAPCVVNQVISLIWPDTFQGLCLCAGGLGELQQSVTRRFSTCITSYMHQEDVRLLLACRFPPTVSHDMSHSRPHCKLKFCLDGGCIYHTYMSIKMSLTGIRL